MTERSPLEIERALHRPQLPSILQNINSIEAKRIAIEAISDEIKALLPHSEAELICFEKSNDISDSTPLRVGVLFSGGQAPGGHNVVVGLFDALKRQHSASRLFGFLAGPSGLIENKSRELTEAEADIYCNTGGFDWLGSGRTKLQTSKQFEQAHQTLKSLNLNALVIIGGDDSNSNAAYLAEYLKGQKSPIQIIGVPKTIDGDLKGDYVEISFGFDSACKLFSEIIGNIARDALSSRKYTHFIKLMGRAASHVTLECALQTHPNLALIAEEIEKNNTTLEALVEQITEVIVKRAHMGKNYGVILVPEGLIEFIPEMKQLISELNRLGDFAMEQIANRLSDRAKATFFSIPEKIQKQLLMDRDPHGNVQVSHIATEELLIEMVARELKKRNDAEVKFSAIAHFLGYEGRSLFPSLFDANYTYALGSTAAALIRMGLSGYLSVVCNLDRPLEEWQSGGVALCSLMGLEERQGKRMGVITKKLIDLQGPVFGHFRDHRLSWQFEDSYCYPGPMQFFGPPHISHTITKTLALESKARAKGASVAL